MPSRLIYRHFVDIAPPELPATVIDVFGYNATNVVNDFAFASWQARIGAVEYRVDISTSPTFATFLPGYNNRQVLVTTLSNIPVLANTTYYIRVRVVYLLGTSINSNVLTLVNEIISKPSFRIRNLSSNSQAISIRNAFNVQLLQFSANAGQTLTPTQVNLNVNTILLVDISSPRTNIIWDSPELSINAQFVNDQRITETVNLIAGAYQIRATFS